jgi:hypothetical protein
MSEQDATWRLVDRVRQAGYDFLTLPEKKRLHDLVVRLKRTGAVSADDLAWLEKMDENLSGISALTAIFSRRNGGAR